MSGIVAKERYLRGALEWSATAVGELLQLFRSGESNVTNSERFGGFDTLGCIPSIDDQPVCEISRHVLRLDFGVIARGLEARQQFIAEPPMGISGILEPWLRLPQTWKMLRDHMQGSAQ